MKKIIRQLQLIYYIYREIQKTISVAYRSEYNNKRKKQVILLMISNGKKQHYLPVTDLFALLKRFSSNHKEDFYCLHCFKSYTSKNKLKEHEQICNTHNSYRIEMPKQVEKNIKLQSRRKIIKSTICNLF